MFGLIFHSRRDEPWWDDDPAVRDRNLSVERALRRHMRNVLNLPNGDGPDPPEKPGGDVSTILSAAFRYGLMPVAFLVLVWVGATEFRKDLTDVREDSRALLRAQSDLINRMDRTDRSMERVINLLFAGCLNNARNQQERNECQRAVQ